MFWYAEYSDALECGYNQHMIWSSFCEKIQGSVHCWVIFVDSMKQTLNDWCLYGELKKR
jgi:hypothetical protein